MADLVMGTMGSLIPKLHQLLKEEYKLQTGVKERISSLTRELEGAEAALHMVAQVPWDQLNEQVKLWARNIREASYDMEDVLDTFLVRVQDRQDSAEQESLLKRLKKLNNLCKRSTARRKISIDVNDIMSHLQEVMERCRRYRVDDVVARPATVSTVDPRLAAMYTEVNSLVGIEKSSGDLMSILQPSQRDAASNTKMKIMSIVGVGGMGKTTLAKAVYDKLKVDFDCRAFIPVGRNPDLKKVYKDILIDLDKHDFSLHVPDERQLIDKLRRFLENKRYFIVIDDVWDAKSWATIKLAMVENSCGSRIIITTRNMNVAKKADEVYELQPLPYDSSRKLFYTRISCNEGNIIDNKPDEISDKFLRRCGGIPLAIITMASLLVDKPREGWSELYKSIDFVCKGNDEAENTMIILSYSYYDLPSHLRTCLLYLSAFPEDSVIPKDALVWKWVAEGFVHEERGIRPFEIGEGYFNELINRSMIQAVELDYDKSIVYGCRVHDMVLDFICSMSRAENFFTVFYNGQDTQIPSNVRRFASHSRTMVNFDMPKVKSFIAQECVIETWAPHPTFKLLRVLAIENCNPADGRRVRIEHLGHLLHLRYLSLRETTVGEVPEEVGALRFLQTLDLRGSKVSDLPSSIRLLTQLMCLRITFDHPFDYASVAFVEKLTSLEELEIYTPRVDVKVQLGSLRKLRVLNATFPCDEQRKRDLVESLRHLHKLHHLAICVANGHNGNCYRTSWEAAGFVLPRHLRHLAIYGVGFNKLPSCINPSCLVNLSHLDLMLDDVDEQDLKILGRLPELRFLALDSWSSATISTVSSESDAGYYLKLRCFRTRYSMVLFVANKEDKSVSFRMWNGVDGIAMPIALGEELHRPIPADSDDELHVRPRKNPRYGLAAIASYFLALFQLVVAFVNRWTLNPLVSDRGSAPGPTATTSASTDAHKGSVCSKSATVPTFMPNLQVLHFIVPEVAMWDHSYCNNLGLEYLSSLREINVHMPRNNSDVKAALRHAADVHPNHPTLHSYL